MHAVAASLFFVALIRDRIKAACFWQEWRLQ